jgi:hypothetical protein
MLNLFQHLVLSGTCETLNQIQGDKKELFQEPIRFQILQSAIQIPQSAICLFPSQISD